MPRTGGLFFKAFDRSCTLAVSRFVVGSALMLLGSIGAGLRERRAQAASSDARPAPRPIQPRPVREDGVSGNAPILGGRMNRRMIALPAAALLTAGLLTACNDTKPASDDTMTEDSMTSDTMTDDSMTSDSMTDDSMTDDTMTEDSMTSDTMTDDSMSTDTMTDGTMTDGNG